MMAMRNVAVSSGSACTSASVEPSYVLRAMGVSTRSWPTAASVSAWADSTTEEEIDFAIDEVVAGGRPAACDESALRSWQPAVRLKMCVVCGIDSIRDRIRLTHFLIRKEKQIMAITLTEKAAGEVKRIISEQQQGRQPPEKIYLRMRVVGGGCSGFQHKLDLDPDVNDKLDENFELHGVAIVGRQAQPDVPERRHGRFPRRPEPPRLQHHQPDRQDHLRLRQLVLDVSLAPQSSTGNRAALRNASRLRQGA